MIRPKVFFGLKFYNFSNNLSIANGLMNINTFSGLRGPGIF